MKSIFIPTKNADDWKYLLSEPQKQWKSGYSAKTLAHCWEDARQNSQDFPIPVFNVLKLKFPKIEALLTFPEYQVIIPGGKRPSQCDIWILAKNSNELVSIAVEGKVKEPFGPTIEEWKVEQTPGKEERIRSVLGILQLSRIPGKIRYQLLHRTVSAILEAKRFNACHAVMLVHAFDAPQDSFQDFKEFVNLFGLTPEKNGMVSVAPISDLTLHFAWVVGEEKYLKL